MLSPPIRPTLQTRDSASDLFKDVATLALSPSARTRRLSSREGSEEGHGWQSFNSQRRESERNKDASSGQSVSSLSKVASRIPSLSIDIYSPSNMSRAGQIALITAGTAAAGLLGYVVYFDYMRRNSPEFRKGLRKQHKKIKQAADAAAKEQEIRDARVRPLARVTDPADNQELTLALVELELETPPSTPEQMEAYFQEHVATAEALAAQGPAEYVKAATHFYRALRVYPQPVELLMIYQKVCPEPVFQLVLKLTQLTSAVNAGAAAGGRGTAAPAQAPASVADIDDSAPAISAPEAVAEAVAEEAAAEVAAEAAAEEAEEEAEEAASSEGAPSANGSGAEWERVSNNA
ncbi:mitochondrial import receptor subunit tom20 [Vanrija albida]|uniref:Mitochondrial import receptor subunit tom20 n=1 Tax=Vanrija albida TaxID=181172 RepID=A0ABR3QFP9_9TREE